MNFPAWQHSISGGLIIAVIAVIHVFVAQFAVGGGFFLVLSERRALRLKSEELLDHTRRQTRFFLLLTMVFGALTGVAIWASIALTAPRASTLLLSEFFFAWASEWAFFLGEIVALLLYQYTFKSLIEGRMPARNHLRLGAAHAAFAFLSLVTINGIITFMLTPGAWLESKNFWDGFFNPTYLPSLIFRFSFSLLLAGLFGVCASLRIREKTLREATLRWCALKWVLAPFVVMAAGAWLYLHALPPDVQQVVFLRQTLDLRPFVHLSTVFAPLLLLGALLLLFRLPQSLRLAAVILTIAIAFGQYGAFEYIRESSRRPWIVHGHMYSNGILATEAAMFQTEGALKAAGGWGGKAEISSAGTLQAGAYLFETQCSTCHGLTGPQLRIIDKVRGRGIIGVEALLRGQGKIRNFMPPFCGTPDERRALAAYLTHVSAPFSENEAGQ